MLVVTFRCWRKTHGQRGRGAGASLVVSPSPDTHLPYGMFNLMRRPGNYIPISLRGTWSTSLSFVHQLDLFVLSVPLGRPRRLGYKRKCSGCALLFPRVLRIIGFVHN